MTLEATASRAELSQNGTRPPAPDFVLGPLTTIQPKVDEVFRYPNRSEKGSSLATQLKAYSDRLLVVWGDDLKRVVAENIEPVEFAGSITLQTELFWGYPAINITQTKEGRTRQTRFIYGHEHAGQRQLRMAQHELVNGEQTQETTVMLGYSSGNAQVREMLSQQTGQGSVVFAPQAA